MFRQVLGPCLEPTGTENRHLWCVRALLFHNLDFASVFLWTYFASDSEKKNPKWIWNGALARRIKGTEFRIIYHDEDQAEVSFTRNWDPSLEGKAVPLNIDKRWMMNEHNSSAIVIREHVEQSKCFCIGSLFFGVLQDSTPTESMSISKDGLILAWERRGWLSSSGKTSRPTILIFSFLFTECLNVVVHWSHLCFWCNFRFHYMALADNRQRIMPMPDDRLPPRGQPLAYPEAVLLVDPINPDLRGEVISWPKREKRWYMLTIHGEYLTAF